MKDQGYINGIIVGGSYSGLSAGMALGRALRHVLIIDSGKPCHSQTHNSHNFITQDGKTTVHGVYASGDSSTRLRTVSYAVSTGTIAGILVNKEIIEEEF